MQQCIPITMIFLLAPVMLNARFAGGDGNEDNPYQIETIEQLQSIEEYPDAHFILINDIDASETADWDDGEGFKPVNLTGSFDGGEYIISDLYINRPEEFNVGLFGSADMATIANVGLVDVHIVGRESVGGIAGINHLSDISNSFVTGSVTGEGRFVGGLVGEFVFFVPSYDEEAEIRNSYADVSVAGESVIGGLVGIGSTYRVTPIDDDRFRDSRPESAVISESFSVGQVTGDDPTGGIAGNGFRDYIKANYWNRESSGQDQWESDGDNSQSDTGLTTEQMTGQNAWIYMHELDFDETWQLTKGYPVLAWQEPDNTVEPPQAAIITVNPAGYDFQEVETSESATHTLSLINSGNIPMSGEVTLTGAVDAFTLIDGDGAYFLDAGDTLRLEVTFRPERADTFDAVLKIEHNAQNRDQPAEITLRGIGKLPTSAGQFEGSDELPEEYELHQNYPNPFNPATIIEFSLPEQQTVTIQIYDLTGRVVEMLIHDRALPPGQHQTTWDGSHAASGIYLYRLTAGDVVLSRQMMLVK